MPKKTTGGFTLTEIMVTIGILGILTSLSMPTFVEEINKSRQKEAQSIVATIPTIISAYIDATGELPTKWDELSSIAAVMTNDGPATGELTAPIILPSENFELSVSGPTDSIYTLTATPRIINEAEIQDVIEEDRFAIKSCFNVSNGASDLKSGKELEIQDILNCG